MSKLIHSLDLRSHWKIFLICIICSFLITAMLKLGVKPPFFSQFRLVDLKSSEIKIDEITPKLEKIPRNFNLSLNNGFIPTTQAAGDFDSASSYIVIDLDSGEILAEKLSEMSMPIASLTKIMTAVVALDLGLPTEKYTVSEKASEVIPTKMGVIPGQLWTLEELLTALLLTSSNDAAEVIMEGINQKYGSDVFITAMNKKAEVLDLKKSSFSNPQGFDSPSNFSSAQDLAILTEYALTNYPLISDIVKKDYQFFEKSSTHNQADLYNWNGLLGVYPGVFGVKIGNTDDAGRTTIVGSTREGTRLLAVVLGTSGILERDLYAAELLDLGFAKFNIKSVNINEEQLKEKYASWKYFY